VKKVADSFKVNFASLNLNEELALPQQMALPQQLAIISAPLAHLAATWEVKQQEALAELVLQSSK
jgi:hypothetical protein